MNAGKHSSNTSPVWMAFSFDSSQNEIGGAVMHVQTHQKLELDEHNYPTDSTLRAIEEWPAEDWSGLMAAIKSIWVWPETCWREEVVPDEFDPAKSVLRFTLSTGGWSGNESIISSLKRNRVIWMLLWLESRRGGLYKLEAPAK
jgi:hypothetical protein